MSELQTPPIKPKNNRVLIQRTPEDSVTKGGIIIPDTAKEKPTKAVVIATGPGLTDRPMNVVIGEKVLISKYAGTEITWAGEEYVLCFDTDILASIED